MSVKSLIKIKPIYIYIATDMALYCVYLNSSSILAKKKI